MVIAEAIATFSIVFSFIYYNQAIPKGTKLQVVAKEWKGIYYFVAWVSILCLFALVFFLFLGTFMSDSCRSSSMLHIVRMAHTYQEESIRTGHFLVGFDAMPSCAWFRGAAFGQSQKC